MGRHPWLSTKNPGTERLARALAEMTHLSVTAAVTIALRERLERLRGLDEKRRERVVDELMKIAEDAGPRWREPCRSTDHGEILYEERGLPR